MLLSVFWAWPAIKASGSIRPAIATCLPKRSASTTINTPRRAFLLLDLEGLKPKTFPANPTRLIDYSFPIISPASLISPRCGNSVGSRAVMMLTKPVGRDVQSVVADDPGTVGFRYIVPGLDSSASFSTPPGRAPVSSFVLSSFTNLSIAELNRSALVLPA